MKLTTQQIDLLYTFTRQHYVEWYDLQSELVDHLANAIETQWQENPKLSFDEALNLAFKKFGVFGFMGVVEEKQKFLDKKYRKLIWEYYKEFFRLPKIIMTIALVYGFYHFVRFFEETKATLFGLVLLSMLFFGYYLYKIDKNIETTHKITGKKWLLENIAFKRKNFIIAFLPLHILNVVSVFNSELDYNGHWANWHLLICCIFYVLFVLYVYIHLTFMPKKVSEELAKTYPDYSII